MRRVVKCAASLAIVYHLGAILSAPASAPPSSELMGSAWEFFSPYLQFLYLNHGHHFFAPEPSTSTLLSYTAEREDGTVVAGRIPSRDTIPRLLYHRHFMLTEHMNQAPDELRDVWYQSYAHHIGRKTGAVKVGLTKQTHMLPSIEDIRDGVRLNDPATYEEQPLGVFQCDPR